MIRIDRYAKKNFDRIAKISNNQLDTTKFEVDTMYFTEWFKANEKKQLAKYEYFYGPYMND